MEQKTKLELCASGINWFPATMDYWDGLGVGQQIRELATTWKKETVFCEDEEIYEKELKLENIIIVGKKSNINQLISEAKVVIGKQSTVIINAFVNNKPIIITNFASDIDFLGMEGIPFVTSPEKFKDCLFEIMKNDYKVSYDIKKIISCIGEKSVDSIITILMLHGRDSRVLMPRGSKPPRVVSSNLKAAKRPMRRSREASILHLRAVFSRLRAIS